MSTWHAQTAGELDAICGVIHDAWFDVADVDHDRNARTLTIPFAQDWRQVAADDTLEYRDAPSPDLIAVTWRHREEKVPFMRGLLRICHVRDVEQDGAIGDAGMLLRLEHDDPTSRLTVHGVSGSVVASIDRLEVACELSRDVVALFVRRRHSRFLGTSSETPLWN
jgi:hypothetical protein